LDFKFLIVRAQLGGTRIIELNFEHTYKIKTWYEAITTPISYYAINHYDQIRYVLLLLRLLKI